ncbi:hypothetical protein [Microbulbifer sp. TRSA005]|uniref:hypothetical protein n=1 Tax=unclassified Microbulbifer TaxID=2619833 RepID=UPI0040397794
MDQVAKKKVVQPEDFDAVKKLKGTIFKNYLKPVIELESYKGCEITKLGSSHVNCHAGFEY